jgi:hypothetical protein
MKSTTDGYIKLKSIFRQKFEQDMDQIDQIIGEITDLKLKISKADLKNFLENILSLEFIQYKPYYKELVSPGSIDSDEDNDVYLWYIGLRAIN